MGDRLAQVAGRGSQDTQVHDAGGVGPDRLDLTFFDDAQHLDLNRQRHGVDSVEKERAVVGSFDMSDTAARGPREGAELMSEQLALDQFLGQGAAVYRDEGLWTTSAVEVKGAGDGFLAGSRLTLDQDVHARVGDLGDRSPQAPDRAAFAQ
ncbi:hypothetical protein D3C81_1461570 [compost metagenome]